MRRLWALNLPCTSSDLDPHVIHMARSDRQSYTWAFTYNHEQLLFQISLMVWIHLYGQRLATTSCQAWMTSHLQTACFLAQPALFANVQATLATEWRSVLRQRITWVMAVLHGSQAGHVPPRRVATNLPHATGKPENKPPCSSGALLQGHLCDRPAESCS